LLLFVKKYNKNVFDSAVDGSKILLCKETKLKRNGMKEKQS
jgi:hypothetical protein